MRISFDACFGNGSSPSSMTSKYPCLGTIMALMVDGKDMFAADESFDIEQLKNRRACRKAL